MHQNGPGVIIHDAGPLEKILDLARRAAEKGFWGVFMTEDAGHNTLMALAAIAQRTENATVLASLAPGTRRRPSCEG